MIAQPCLIEYIYMLGFEIVPKEYNFENQPKKLTMNTLVTYYSHTGNNRFLARQIAEKTLSIRHQGFFGNAMLTLDELSQSDIINIIRELDDRFVTRKPKAS